MHDRNVSLNATLAAILWPLGLVVIVADLFISGPVVSFLGLAGCAAGAVFNVRDCLCKQTAQCRTAFTLGQDVGRAEGERVPRIR